MSDRMTIDLVEEVDTSEEYDDDTEQIGTQQKAHNDHRNHYGCCNCVPFFTSFEFVFKCPRKFFHTV